MAAQAISWRRKEAVQGPPEPGLNWVLQVVLNRIVLVALSRVLWHFRNPTLGVRQEVEVAPHHARRLIMPGQDHACAMRHPKPVVRLGRVHSEREVTRAVFSRAD